MSEPQAFPTQAFPWDEALMLALGVLRWSPRDFWRATPRELIAAWEGLSGGRGPEPALGRDLRRLMAAFPDGA
ncbi:phage tail assembly chaperone [Microvirga subterranea]|uniref:Putative phage protein (TIGR02216 family) n=1 Tax=Microvirga subterranea TaxID=186651 RepID=A0A370HJG2_9HYPH|nr:phage tail assembly chaperone [Microvirga subterranea]RDI58723.1 putative phage protein (TIGR02216 family) [Microvirga subterranea]